MKTLALLLLGLSVGFLRADDTGTIQAQNAQWNQDYKESTALAVKLYPEVSDKSSDLFKMTQEGHRILAANGSQLPTLSTYPLILCLYEASQLHLKPQWESLTDDERFSVFLELKTSLSYSKDFATQASTSPPSSSTPVPARPTVTDRYGRSYWVSEADYQRLHPISLELDAESKKLDVMQAQLDARGTGVERDRAYLDNTNPQAVDDFNAEVDAYNTYHAYVGKQTDDYNTRVDAFNSELHRMRPT